MHLHIYICTGILYFSSASTRISCILLPKSHLVLYLYYFSTSCNHSSWLMSTSSQCGSKSSSVCEYSIQAMSVFNSWSSTTQKKVISAIFVVLNLSQIVSSNVIYWCVSQVKRPICSVYTANGVNNYNQCATQTVILQ